jgi:hypothetical protein
VIYNFYIEDLYIKTTILEPRDWKDLKSVFERDFNTHGVFFDYTDKTLKLGFSCEARDLLETAYQAYGIDAYYIFEVTEQDNEYDSETIIFNGQIDFSTRQLDEEFFNAEVNSSNVQLKFKNRKKTKINLNAGKDLDGNTLANMNYDDSIRLLAAKPRAELNLVKQTEASETTQSTGGFTYYTVGLQNSSGTEIEKFKAKRNYGYTGDGIVNDLYFDPSGKEFLELERDAELQITISWNIVCTVTNVSGGPGTYGATLEFWTIPEAADETGAKEVQYNIDSGLTSPITLSGSDTFYMSAKAGFKIALICTVSTTAPAETVNTTMAVNTLDLDIVDVRAEKGDKVQWYRLHDALNKNLNYLTGKYDYLYSNLLGHTTNGYTANGCLSDMFMINGFRIRGLNDAKKAPSFSFDDFFNTLNALQAIGYGFEQLQSPAELGYKDVQWIDVVSGTSTIRINENLTSDITVNSNLGFYDNETIYGVYEVTAISWSGVYTEIELDTSANTNFYDNVYDTSPSVDTYTCYLTCDSTTSERERLRVERWEHFYGSNELLDLGVVEEYSEEPLMDIYNEIGFEFKKYSNDEKMPLTLQDFSTRASWALPVEKSDRTKDLMIPFLASTGLIIESQLNKITDKPTTSNKLDEDIFFSDKISKSITVSVDFDSSGFIKVPDYVYDNYIYGADKFTVSGSTLNDGLFHINFGTPPFFNLDSEEWTIYVVESVSDDTDDSCTIAPNFNGQIEYKPETLENMDAVTGITETEYTYNQRRTFKRMLLRWGAFIRSLVSYTPNIGELKNLFYINNGEMTTDLDVTSLDSDCYEDAGLLVEEDNVDISSLSNPIFKPNIINFTKKICDSDYDLIKDAHRNKDIYDRNYGYIKAASQRDNKTVTGWIMKLSRSPIDKICKITILERNGEGIGSMIIGSTNIVG